MLFFNDDVDYEFGCENKWVDFVVCWGMFLDMWELVLFYFGGIFCEFEFYCYNLEGELVFFYLVID